MKHISYFGISLLLLMFVPLTSYSQEANNTKTDTLIYKERYGLRLGIDIFRPIRSFLDENHTSFEINGDYRLTTRLYLAGELGTEEVFTKTEYLDVTANGSYFKAGVDYNFYQNWLDMENMIYGGFRVGVSSFSQTLNSYTIYNTNQYYDEPVTITEPKEFNGLSAIWAEFIIGMKVEVIDNFFIGVNAQLKARITEKKPEDFANLHIPGFNKVSDGGGIGIGFGYQLSYLIPIYNKQKKVVVENE